MTEPHTDRFQSVARAKHDALLEVYNDLQVAPDAGDDKALYQRQSAGKALLTHIALLRKLLHLDVAAKAGAASDTLDIDGYRAMVADLDAAGLDAESERG